jgi:sec-independent protein translocase protein TatC
MLMLLGVVGALYEVGIVAAQMFVKHTKAPDAEADAEKP